jgi:hypothetical protein
MKRLTDRDIDQICSILDGWSGKLTWDALTEAIKVRLGHNFTRQALDRHERIKLAFTNRKRLERSGEGKPEARTVEMQKAIERIERLQAENERLKAENNQLLAQFARWAYNAYAKGLTEEYLNRPLAAIDRDRTKL